MQYGTASSLQDFYDRYNDEEACVQALFKFKWPFGFRCPNCSHSSYYLINTRRLPLYECHSCHKQTSLTVGTIMEGSRTPLKLWFLAIYYHTQPRFINATQLSDLISVTYKTAWLLLHKIRHAMSVTESKVLLTGKVSVSDGIYCRRLTPYFDWHKQEQSLLIAAMEDTFGELNQLKIVMMPKKVESDKYIGSDPKLFFEKYVDSDSSANIVITPRYGRKMNKSLAWKSFGITRWLANLFRGIGPKHLQVYLDQYCYIENHKQQNQPLLNCILSNCATTSTITYRNLTRPSVVTSPRSLQRERKVEPQRMSPIGS